MKNEEIKFKNYDWQYETVFSNEERIEKKCKLEQVAPFNNRPLNTTLYVKQLRETIKEMELNLFDSLVKCEWLKRRFCYKGRRINGNRYPLTYKMAYGLFMRHHVGFNNRYYFSFQSPFSEVFNRYVDDFFPNFDSGDPFKEKYEYPYSYIGLDCLSIVSKMPERMDLLKIADSRKMKYSVFLDYVINYISCYNEEHGEKYRVILSRDIYPYIKVLKNEDDKKETSSIRARRKEFLPSEYIRTKFNTPRHVGRSDKSKRAS